ncbi:hypothetical protein P7C70_g6293, partial [Phenoliferia sp. Uapishka_3]
MAFRPDSYHDSSSTDNMLQRDTSLSGHGAGRGGDAAGGGGVREDERFLDQARRIDITAADRQEGYDADLLNLQPRTGQADAEAAAALTDAEKGLDSPSVSLAPGAYASRSKTNDAPHRRRSKKVLPPKRNFFQRPVFLLIILAIILVIGLAVGLGVGLGTKKSGSNKGSSSLTPASSGIPVSTTSAQPNGGLTPSVSQTQASETGETVQPASRTAIPLSVTQSPAEATVRARALRKREW